MTGSIWAQNAQGVIGLNGKMPWRYSGDFKRFKRVTMGSTVIMGRKTWESIGTRPLPGRINCVVTSDAPNRVPEFGGLVMYSSSIQDALDLARLCWAARSLPLTTEDIWFIGGARIYQAAMEYVDVIDVTYVPDVVPTEGAVLAPTIDLSVFEVAEWVHHEDEPTLIRRLYRRRQA